MTDTAFWAEPAAQPRLAALYRPSRDGRAVRLDELGQAALRQPRMLGGGGGLVSTAADYDRFTRMLLHTDASPAGELDGTRLLSPRTVGYMARNHLPGNKDLETFGRPLYAESPFRGVGFGLGFAVLLDPVPGKVIGTAGELSWGGAAEHHVLDRPGRGPDRLVLHPAAPVQHLPDPPAAAPARLPGADRLITAARRNQPGLVRQHDRLDPVAQLSLARILATCVFTVASLSVSVAASSALLSPRATSPSTSSSRGVSAGQVAAPAGARRDAARTAPPAAG